MILWTLSIFVLIFLPQSRAGEVSHSIAEAYGEITNTAPEAQDSGEAETQATVEEDNEAEEEETDIINEYEKNTRKVAHFLQYALLGVLSCLAFSRVFKKIYIFFPASVIYSSLVAALDEFTQSFLETRTGCVEDAYVDIYGAAAGAFCVLLILLFKAWRKKKSEK